MMYLSDDDDESEEHVSICKNCNELVQLICKCQQLILSQYILLHASNIYQRQSSFYEL